MMMALAAWRLLPRNIKINFSGDMRRSLRDAQAYPARFGYMMPSDAYLEYAAHQSLLPTTAFDMMPYFVKSQLSPSSVTVRHFYRRRAISLLSGDIDFVIAEHPFYQLAFVDCLIIATDHHRRPARAIVKRHAHCSFTDFDRCHAATSLSRLASACH